MACLEVHHAGNVRVNILQHAKILWARGLSASTRWNRRRKFHFPCRCSDANSSNSFNSFAPKYFFLDFKSLNNGCRTADFCLASPFHFAVVFSRQSQSTVSAEEVENIFLPKIIISPISSTPSLFGERFIIIMENTHFRCLLVFLFHCFLIYICIAKVSEKFLFSWQKKWISWPWVCDTWRGGAGSQAFSAHSVWSQVSSSSFFVESLSYEHLFWGT